MHKDRLPLRFDRNEFAGAFGDVGTDIPLILLLIPACNLDARSVLMMFGACQIFSAFAYRLPIPVQPMKAMATIAIAAVGTESAINGQTLAAAALLAGAAMMLLSQPDRASGSQGRNPRSPVRFGYQTGDGGDA